jgi:peptide/nickel transport system permease protein
MQLLTHGLPMTEKDQGQVNYWTIVWGQFLKNNLAMFGLLSIFCMVLIAVYAPFLSLDKPLFFYDGEVLVFPLFRSLFDRNFFENGVDIFFNLQIFLLPTLLFSCLIRTWVKKVVFLEALVDFLGGYIAISLSLFLLVQAFPYHEGWQDWNGKVQEARDAGQEVISLSSLRPFSYREPSTLGVHPMAPNSTHLLGTDKEGRDILARMIFGTRISLTIGLVAVSIYILIGIILGSIAGFFGGMADLLVSRFIEIMLCFPTFFLILTLSALIQEKSIFHVMLIIGFTRWPEVARLVRAEFLKLKSMDYVQAAIALGFSRTRVIFGHVLPNALGPVIVTAVFGVASSILIESSLSFLGLGDLSAPSWGEILSQGRQEYKLWLILCPGLAIFLVVSVFNLVGEGLQDAMDPKLRR